MATAAYPASLPTARIDGYQEGLPDNLVRNEMSVGPPQTRRRSTLPLVPVQVSLILTASQKTTLTDFFNDTLQHGSLQFQATDFADPSGTDYLYQFREPPQLRPIGGGNWSTTLQLWRVRPV